MKRPITEYMDIFIKETNTVALAESKERAFQLYAKHKMQKIAKKS